MKLLSFEDAIPRPTHLGFIRLNRYTQNNRDRRSTLTMLAKFFLLCSAMILFCVLMYIPVYNKANNDVSKGTIAGWTAHTNRDIKIYVRPHNITMVHEPREVCAGPNSSKNNLFLLIVVCSSTLNFDRRATIRETWGNYTNYIKHLNVYKHVTEKYKNYNFSYDLYPATNEIKDDDTKVRARRSIYGYVHLLPELAKALEQNLYDAKTESVPDVNEKRFEDDDAMLPEFDMNKALNEQHDYDYDYDTNVMKIPPKGYEENPDLGAVLKLLKGKKFPNIKRIMDEHKYEIDHNTYDSSKLDFKLVFLLGLPPHNASEVQIKIEEEINKYGDIIQEDFIDSYSNLTLKSIMMLKWITTKCKDSVRYILKTDDDVYINVPNLMASLTNRSRDYDTMVANGHKDKEYLLIGDLICGARPVLDRNNKWYSPRYMYPGRVYPRYVSGTGYAMSSPAAAALYEASLRTPYFHLEDVFVTGICAAVSRPRLRPRREPGFSRGPLGALAACSAHARLSAHRVPPDVMRQLTASLADQRLVDKCERMRLTEVRKERSRAKIKRRKNKLYVLYHYARSVLTDKC